jgi:DNA-binding transcriptional MerR regulator
MTAALAKPKSPEAFRTISEVSAELDVPQHVLRFWETRFAQIKPVKRAGGRRYYRPEDVELLRGIRSLLYADGYTIKGVQKILKEQGLRHVAEIGRHALRSGNTARILPLETDKEPRYARAAIARVREAHAELFFVSAEIKDLDDQNRTELELLLAELLQMKARLRGAREHFGG